ncbi:MAG: DGQHR domain-containing protein [Candidatus Methanoperedens sp.]|nr:DGQHR domain-containing protein [Candidatus Methanoperedens sp.]
MSSEKVALEGLASGDDLVQTYKKRNVKYVYKQVVKQDLQPYFDEGWGKIGRGSKKFFRLRKLKDIALGFEDEVWCIFNKMGFDEMNKDRNFSIPREGSNVSKQIDVFARDEQCICIIECKAAEKPHTKRSLDKDIDQLAGIRHELELSIFSHYKNLGHKNKFKVVWILTLKNIDISENDRERAKSANIRVIDESMIEYYSALSNHFGRSSKYQFLADMFPGREIPVLIEPVPAIKGKMGKTDFYSFVIEPEKLLKIAYIAHRAKSNEESIKTYQRMARKSRLKEIAEYIHEKEGIFPTNIVLNIQTDRPLRFDPAAEMAGKNAILGTLYIPNKYKTAWIIDGQHRLFAYSGLEEANTATLPVIAFENLEPNIQAELFIDINGEQVKVSKNLLSDLWATIHWNSENPGEQLKALTSRLVKELNEHQESPLRDRIINIGGRKTKTRNITLTALIDEINKRNLLGSISSRNAKVITPGPLFVDDLENTLPNARKIISGYLSNYINNSENLRKQWETGSGEGGYICTNSGLIALLRILYAILNHIEHVDHLDIKKMKSSEILDNIWKYQEPVCRFLGSASLKVIQDFRSQHGEGGFRACTFALLWEINKIYANFVPPGLQQWIQSKDNSNNPRAYDMVSKIETDIMNYVINRLKSEFGTDLTQWWHKGVSEKIRSPAILRAQNAGEYYHPERFVDLIDWSEIIYQNSILFGEIFTIKAKQNDGKKKKLSWFGEINEIRKIVAHPPRGGISDAQLTYLTEVYNELMPRLKNE